MYKFQTSRGPDNRGTEGDEGEGIWEGVSPSPADYTDLGEHHKLPQWGPARQKTSFGVF